MEKKITLFVAVNYLLFVKQKDGLIKQGAKQGKKSGHLSALRSVVSQCQNETRLKNKIVKRSIKDGSIKVCFIQRDHKPCSYR